MASLTFRRASRFLAANEWQTCVSNGIFDAGNMSGIPHALLVNFGRPSLQYDTFDLDKLPRMATASSP